MDYLDTLKKFVSGKKYASSNIKSSDGKLAYVTATGVSKPYPSMDVYSKTAGKNNCGGNFIQLQPKWDDLGFPVGSLMKSGQSCGYENSYIQAKPPDMALDWKYYVQANPELKLTTEAQANDHWNNVGKQEGRLPNPNVLTSMQFLGKVGYVDVNTALHLVPPTYNGTYQTYNKTNLTGINMEDCTRPIPTIKYGDQLILMFNDKTGFMNDSSILELGSKVTHLFLRPPLGLDLQGKTVNYGDQVSITTSTSSYTSTCGWWGCKVGRVNPINQQLDFGPGGESTTTFRIEPPRGSAYALGTSLKYGDPFMITSPIINNNAVLKEGDSILPGKRIQSAKGYMFIYLTNGNIGLYRPNGTVVWQSNVLHTPKNLTLQSDGNLVAYDTEGVPKWSTNTYGQGTGPYVLTLDESVELTDSTKKVLWSTASYLPTTANNTPIAGVAYVKNTLVTFGTWNEGKNANVFSFKAQTTEPTTCNIEDMKKHCDQSNCSGFIHSPATNSWQMITPTSTNDYTISNTMQDIYVKNATVNIHDTSCPSGTAHLVEASLFGNYVMGADFVDKGSAQCNVIDPPKPPKTYVQRQQQIVTKGQEYVNQYNHLNVQAVQSKNVELQKQMKTKTEEYETVLSKLKKETKSDTLQQQYVDMTVFDEYNKSHTIVWGVVVTLLLTTLFIKMK